PRTSASGISRISGTPDERRAGGHAATRVGEHRPVWHDLPCGCIGGAPGRVQPSTGAVGERLVHAPVGIFTTGEPDGPPGDTAEDDDREDRCAGALAQLTTAARPPYVITYKRNGGGGRSHHRGGRAAGQGAERGDGPLAARPCRALRRLGPDAQP